MNTFEDKQTPDPASSSAAPESRAANELDGSPSLDDRIIAALREVYDPEIPVNIYDLGLIYRIDCDNMGVVEIDMTLTAPGCPVAQTFPGTVEAAVQNVEGVAAAEVDLVWEPPWTPDRMSEAAKLELGLF
jgi:FeS assembly SUF system protein